MTVVLHQRNESDKLQALGLESAQLNSALPKREADASLERVEGGTDFVFRTPALC
jgi:hypothetical protein